MKKSSTHKKETSPASEEQLITRKQAIKKTGYIALSAATMMLLLNNSANGQTGSPVNSQPAAIPKDDGIWNDTN